MKFVALINQHYEQLTEQERHLLIQLQQLGSSVAQLSSQDLAETCYVSRSSIFRLLKKLGLGSFAELKLLLQEETSPLPTSSFRAVSQAYHTYIDQIFKTLDLKPIVALLKSTDVLYLYGTGNEQKLEVENFRQLFTTLGKKVIVFFDEGEYDYVKPSFGQNDLMILLSYKGESAEGIRILKDSKLKGIKRLVITKTSQNTMAQLADYQLYVPTESIQTPTKLTYEVSTTFYLMIDQLYFDYLMSEGVDHA